MKVYVEKERKYRSVSARVAGTVAELLDRLKINPSTVLVVRNGHLVTESAKLKDSDEIKIISVVSGG
ncbi:MAG: thiamine biosynthesis protein ThiS [Thermodesulfobacteriota bacterium]|nr:MAG: thiamine biosynthesis protein ThiS [Thermodesulfobacteriota bacterium]